MSMHMHKVTKYFARFFSPGTFVADDWRVEVPSPNPEAIAWPTRAYCFQVVKREDIVDDGAVFTGKEERVGPTYYHPDSKVEHLAQVKLRADCHILARNMECNDWPFVVWSRWETGLSRTTQPMTL